MNAPTATHRRTHPLDLARCIDCGAGLDGSRCSGCGRSYRVSHGILEAIGPLTGRNRVAATFYEGNDWARFRPWERLFLFLQGPGEVAARRQILRHLPVVPGLRVLEVGIGDGENVPLLPESWEVYGVDIARSLLNTCRARFASTDGRLAWAEGERLPFEDGAFDAVFTVGGINYFSDPAGTLREMNRVARSGATLIAADELPDLNRFGLGSLLGFEGLDRFWLRATGLAPEFVAMVMDTPPLVERAARLVWPGHRRWPIWNRLGYCLVDVKES